MEGPRPFVVTVASEKGGVGKTTIATNLAVYLKALREDLPVTIASFDNHFSIEGMFAIGPRPCGGSVADLFAGAPVAELARLGEYGVQYIPSARILDPPDDDTARLGRLLTASPPEGVLILDTRPILDYFTLSALRCADLVLVPVKDRSSLLNAASLRNALAGAQGRMWLIPSLIDARLRLRGGVGMEEFLRACAEERDYQVADVFISKSPKVEGLATDFSSTVRPVLSHARGTAVHGQLHSLALFVLERLDAGGVAACTLLPPPPFPDVPPGRLRRLLPGCPACGQFPGKEAHLLFDVRGRRRGFVHAECLQSALESTGLLPFPEGTEAFALEISEGSSERGSIFCHLLSDAGSPLLSEPVGDEAAGMLLPLLEWGTGKGAGRMIHELVILSALTGSPAEMLRDPPWRRFARLRRGAARELLGRF